ncbi:hypothetical protein FRC12_016147 [Ceratobasidium sp. 428]|nr:hypothetical protein FRC12_016147 [Ceratobasidium sp. 428]
MTICAFLGGLILASTGYLLPDSIQAQQIIGPITKPTLTQITLAGAGAGIIVSLIATPTKLIKIRQQASSVGAWQPSARSAAEELWRGRGVRGLYKGVSRTTTRDMSYGAYFTSIKG